MGFRSRALLTGVAHGFFKAQNDRRDRMAERMQTLADERSKMAQERAKSQYDSALKSADEEEKQFNQLRAVGHIDENGNYTKNFWKDSSYADWRQNGNGMSQDEYTEVYKQGRPQQFIRNYKTKDELTADLTKTYGSIEARQSVELQQPVLTDLDRTLGRGVIHLKNAVASGVNAVSDAVGLGASMDKTDPATMDQGVAPDMAIPSISGSNPNQGKITYNEDKGLQFKEKPAFTSGVKGYSQQTKELFIDEQPVSGAFERERITEQGAKVTEYGFFVNGQFEVDTRISEHKGTTKPKEEIEGQYVGGENLARLKEANVVLSSISTSQQAITSIKNAYNPQLYGTEGALTSVGNMIDTLTTVVGDSTLGLKEKQTALSAIQKSSKFDQLPNDLKVAIRENKEEDIKRIVTGINYSDYSTAVEYLSLQAETDEERAIVDELSKATVSAEIMPLARSLLSVWTAGGDRKPAWGAVEKLTEELAAGASSEVLLGKLSALEVGINRDAMNALRNKWEASRYTAANDSVNGVVDFENGFISAKEYFKDPVTGEIVQVRHGANSKGVFKYVIKGNSDSIMSYRLPTKQGEPLTPKDINDKKYIEADLSKYTVRVNANGLEF